MDLTCIIKVGAKGSVVKFNNIKMLRAISNSEIERLVKENETTFFVFEGSDSSDSAAITSLIEKIGRKDDCFFFNCIGDGPWTGELERNSFTDLKDMQRVLSFKYKLNIRTYRVGVDAEYGEEKQRLEAERLEREKAEREEAERIEKERLEREEQERLEKESLQAGQEEETDGLEEETDGLEEEDLSKLFEVVGLGTGEESSEAVEENLQAEEKESLQAGQEEEPSGELIEPVEEEPVKEEPLYYGKVSLKKKITDAEKNKEELDKALLKSVSYSEEKDREQERLRKEKARNVVETLEIDNKDEEVYVWNPEEEEEKASEIDTAEVKRLTEELELKDKRIEVTEERLQKLIKIKESLLDRVGFYESILVKLEDRSEVVDIQAKDSRETLNKLAEARLNIKQLENRVIELQNELGKIDSLQEELQGKDDVIDKLQSELQEARTDDRYKEIESNLESEVAVRLQIISLLKNLSSNFIRLDAQYKSLVIERDSLNETNTQLTRDISSLSEALRDTKDDLNNKLRIRAERERALNLKLDDFNRKVIESNNEIEKAIKEKEEALTAKSTLEVESNKLRDAVTDLKSRLKTVESDLDIKENVNNDLQIQLNKFKSMDIEKLQEDARISDIGNSQMMQELGRAKQEIQAIKFQMNQRDMTIKRLEEEKNRMEITNKSLSRNVASAERLMIDVQYNAKASIIAVFGSGSYGTTTTAVSIARKLPGNVLLLDFDCVNPKIDAWAEMNPMIKELDGLTGLDQSAFGALIKKGTDYVIENRDKIFRRKWNTNKKSNSFVYYFSGIYNNIDLSEFASIDFQQFLNFFGNEYNYIVVDLGRLGGNESTNALIRMFNKISWRNIMVCLHDKNDLRTTFIKSKMQGISYTKTIWLMNMAKNTKIDDSMKKVLRGMDYTIFNADMDNYGEKMTFTEFGNPNRAKLDELVEKITC